MSIEKPIWHGEASLEADGLSLRQTSSHANRFVSGPAVGNDGSGARKPEKAPPGEAGEGGEAAKG